MNQESCSNEFYRCQVSSEQAKATIWTGGRKIPATLRETAIDGFTIIVAGKYARWLRLGCAWTMKARGERNRVHAEWIFHANGQDVQIGLRRLEEVLDSNEPKGGFRTYFGRSSLSSYSDYAGLALAGLSMTIFLLLSLPGVGDRLGTAPIIQQVARSIMNIIGGWIP